MSSHVECVELVLPAPVELQSHLDAAENHLLSTLEVDTQLNDVAIIERKSFTLLGRWTQSNVVEESARGTLDILDIPDPILVPEFTVATTDDLALKSHRCGRRHVSR